VVGFYVLESKETPGLGDKIEKDPTFLANFEDLDVSLSTDGQTLEQEVTMVKSGTKRNPWEIDAITGATISSRAITEIIGTSMAEMAPKIVAQKETFSQPSTE
jgi:electron transport complex protein RnfG